MNRDERNIDYRDISVVAQGAVAGSPNDKYENRHTYRCLESIRKSLPGATIILATWKGSNVAGLDYDVLVESEDPGPVAWGNVSQDGRQTVGSVNGLRQIVGSRDGLRACKTKYSLRIRNDLILWGDKFLDYFITYNKLPFDDNYKILKKRIVTMTTGNPRRRNKFPFTIGDWFFFGLTEDVVNVFDLPLVKKEFTNQDNDGRDVKVDSLYTAEQNIWFGFLSKYRKIPFECASDISHDNITTSERYFANNCIFLTARRAGVYCLKYPDAAYGQIPALSNSGLYTFSEYKELLNKYANNHLLIIPNIFENITYYIVYNLRFYIEKKSPKLWDIIRRTVNRKNHRRIDALKKARGANGRTS